MKQFRLFWPFYYSCTLNSTFFFILVVKQLHACTTVLMKQNLWQEYCLESFWLWMPNVEKIVEHRLVSRYVFLQDFLVPAVWNKKNWVFLSCIEYAHYEWDLTRFYQSLSLNRLCATWKLQNAYFSQNQHWFIWLFKI